MRFVAGKYQAAQGGYIGQRQCVRRGGKDHRYLSPFGIRAFDIRKSDPLWRITGDGHGTTLVIIDAGLFAVDIEANAPQSDLVKSKPKIRVGTKRATRIAMLKSPEGATIIEIAEATGLQSHTMRGAMSGVLKKRLGLTITRKRQAIAAGSTAPSIGPRFARVCAVRRGAFSHAIKQRRQKNIALKRRHPAT